MAITENEAWMKLLLFHRN